MPRRVLALTAVLAALVLAAPAHAQSPIKFGLSLGPSFPTGDLGDEQAFAQDWGYHIAGHLAFKAPLTPVGLRAEGFYQGMSGKTISGFDVPDITTWGLTANGELELGGVGLKPYLIGGLGAYGLSNDANNDLGIPEQSDTKFGWNIGAGLNFGLAGFSTFAEARFHQVQVDNGNFRFVPVTFGIRF